MCQSSNHYATQLYVPTIKFDRDDAEMMYLDPKSLIHGLHDNYGLAENGIREYSESFNDRGPKNIDDSYNQEAIKFNQEHASEMFAQFLTSQNFKVVIRHHDLSESESKSESESEGVQLKYPLVMTITGPITVDSCQGYTESLSDCYEMAHIRFHIDTVCIEMTLQESGYKFESHEYKWVLSHLSDGRYEYNYHSHPQLELDDDDQLEYTIDLLY